ncbi:MAG: preprotein translocase subunit SecA, partial [Actinomycetota bacterium]
AMAQRDPLVEYQREGYSMFQQMMAAIREESISFLFNLEIKQNAPQLATPQPAQMVFSAPSEQGAVETHEEKPRPASKPNQTGPGSSFFRG